MAIKGKHGYFEKQVRDRKTSKTVYGHVHLSKVEVKIPGGSFTFLLQTTYNNNKMFAESVFLF